MNSSGRVFVTLAFLTMLAALAVTGMRPADARERISSGRDLYDACQALAAHALNPQGAVPRAGLYCRQYIEGYFAAIKYVQENDDAQKVLGVPPEGDCLRLSGTRSFDQLAAQVIRTAEWNPPLLDRPAIHLARKTFGSRPPC